MSLERGDKNLERGDKSLEGGDKSIEGGDKNHLKGVEKEMSSFLVFLSFSGRTDPPVQQPLKLEKNYR